MRGRLSADPVSLASGALVCVLGALLLLDSAGAIDLDGWFAVAAAAAVGAILLVSGISGDEERQD